MSSFPIKLAAETAILFTHIYVPRILILKYFPFETLTISQAFASLSTFHMINHIFLGPTNLYLITIHREPFSNSA